MATVNLSTLAAPTPPPTPVQPCAIQVLDLAFATAKPSSAGTVAVPVAGAHTFSLKLDSPFASNTVTVNGVIPAGWSALAAGQFATIVVDAVGLWTFQVTTPGAAPNSVTIQGY